MKARYQILLIGAVLLPLVAAAIVIIRSPSNRRPSEGGVLGATRDARQVGIAILLFSKEHGGAMPAKLNQLVPKYLPDPRLFQHTRLTTPGANLGALPKDSIIAFRLVPNEPEAVVVITSDIRVTHLFLR